MSPMVRIDDSTAKWLKELSEATGITQTKLIDRALQNFQQDREAVMRLIQERTDAVNKHLAEIEKTRRDL